MLPILLLEGTLSSTGLWTRILLQKATVTQLDTEFPACYATQRLITVLQQPTTSRYPESDESSSNPNILDP
jgi:hypothetical protein